MVQFVLIFTHQFQTLFTSCNYPKVHFDLDILIYIIIYVILYTSIVKEWYRSFYLRNNPRLQIKWQIYWSFINIRILILLEFCFKNVCFILGDDGLDWFAWSPVPFLVLRLLQAEICCLENKSEILATKQRHMHGNFLLLLHFES